MTDLEQWQIAVMNFAKAIQHGDEVHREWLLAAAKAFVSGEELPPPPEPEGQTK